MKNIALIILSGLVVLSSCKKDEPEEPPVVVEEPAAPRLIFKLKFDPTQARLDAFGNPSTVPANHGAQSPFFNTMSTHYIELAQDDFTLLGDGEIVYQGAELTHNGAAAVDFDNAIIKAENQEFYSLPISSVTPGTYEWTRVSVTYQNYDVSFKAFGTDMTGTVASFVGFNTYITDYILKTETETVNDSKLQGYWGFETHPNAFVQSAIVNSGEAEQTTVPNPNFANSPIPAGSCVVTGEFGQPLVITGNETEDVVVVLSFSTNQSFEWKDDLQNNIYEPLDGDTIVDMGLRGLIPIVQ